MVTYWRIFIKFNGIEKNDYHYRISIFSRLVSSFSRNAISAEGEYPSCAYTLAVFSSPFYFSHLLKSIAEYSLESLSN